jgi:osmoprotectant transport system ATP-binding protein
MARALAAQQRILLLDEPFGALDAITRAELQAMFASVRRRRPVTCVLVTHDLFEARKLADRIAVMREGRIEQIDTPHGLVDRPATDYVARLLEKAGVVRAPREAS